MLCLADAIHNFKWGGTLFANKKMKNQIIIFGTGE